MQNKRIARLIRTAFLREPLMGGFTDIRTRPSIGLRAILMSLWTMPLFGAHSLLSNDRSARTERYKALFGCRRKMVVSDTTCARVLKWLKPEEGQRFLLGWLPRFERRDLLRQRLSPAGKPRRLGILDGSYMGGHWLVTLCLAGRINYPIMVERCATRGQELTVAHRLMRQVPRVLGKLRPQLWLLDAKYFTVNTIALARRHGAHLLFKFKDPDYRTVTSDAQNLFQHFGADEESTGWDASRECRWRVRATRDRFSAWPVQVVQLIEHYPKRRREATVISWIVTTDLELPREELREAAHRRWQIENNVFKRLSHLAGTKRFYFKDPRQFFNLLRLFCAAVAVLDSIIAMLVDHPRLFAALRAGIKATWRNVFSQVAELLYGLPEAFVSLT